MNNTITWLHISDTHFCKAKNGWDSEEILVSFFNDLKNMEEKYNLHPDLIFFTGDVALGHIGNSIGLTLKDQYEEARKFLEKVRKTFLKEIPLKNVFIVPGNHDINRTLVTEILTCWLDSLINGMQKKGRDRVNKSISENDREWKTLMVNLNDYKEFLEYGGYHHLLKDPDRLMYSIKRCINGFEVGIAGLNSAWSSCSDGNKGDLWLGTYQISEAHNNLRDTMLSIVISHHPPNWFTEFEDPLISRKIESDFNFYLHGHEHQEWVTPMDSHIRIGSGALYNGSEKKNGYNFVRLYPSENRGEVFLRTYDNGAWIPNIIGKKTDNEGRWILKSLNIGINNIENRKEDYVDIKERASQATNEIKGEIVKFPNYMSVPELDPQFLDQMKYHLLNENQSIKPIFLYSYELIHSSFLRAYSFKDIRITSIKYEQLSDLTLEEKVPSLQELKTQEQVNKHFIPLPRVVSRISSWISNRKDLLFQGFPFCGKTSFVTYLAYECLKLDDSLQPIRIDPPKDLTIDDVPVSVSRMLQKFKQENIFESSKRPILILENVHLPSHYEIFKVLINENKRIWRVWATARPHEFKSILRKGESLGENLDIVNDACDLLRDEDIEYIFGTIIEPRLIAQKLDYEEVDSIKKVIKSRGNVPFRFIMKIIDTINSNTVQPIEGYASLFAREPTETEEIVRSLWPVDNRYSQEGLFVAYYLPKPSWWILQKIIDDMTEVSGEYVLTELRSSLALVNDSDDPSRATMYDPVSEKIVNGDFITQELKNRVWNATKKILSEHKCSEESPLGSYDMWMDFGRFAKKEGELEIGTKLFEIAISKSTNSKKLDSLNEYVDCLLSLPKPDFEGSIKVYHEILGLLDKEQKEERKTALGDLCSCLLSLPNPDFERSLKVCQEILSLLDEEEKKEDKATFLYALSACFGKKLEPEWENAIKASQEALILLDMDNKKERADILSWLAKCMHDKPEPDWENAIKTYQEALSLVDEEIQKRDQADSLFWLAYCMHNKPEPDWENAIKTYQEALSLLAEEGQKENLAVYILFGLAYCMRNKPEPNWENAIKTYQELLSLLDEERQKEERADSLYWLANCMHIKPEPDWENAIKTYQEALSLFNEERQKEDLAASLFWLAFCMHNKPEPDWESAIKTYQDALSLLDEKGQKEYRLHALSLLAICMHNKPEPDWGNAIKIYQELLSLLDEERQKEERADSLFWLAYCMHNKPKPDWENAIKTYQESLSLFNEERQKEKLATSLFWLASCMQNKPEPDWESAIKTYQEALSLLDEEGQKENLAVYILFGLAYCMHNKPEPDWGNAIKIYQELLSLLDEEKQKRDQADSLYWLAYCMHNKPEPDWESAIKTYQEALSLFNEERQKEKLANSLFWLAYCMHNKPEPDWESAIKTYQDALSLFNEERQKEEVAASLAMIAFCLHRKPNPDWTNSIRVFRKSIEIFRASNVIQGLIICYDAIEEFEEADNWAKKLQDTDYKVKLFKDTSEYKILLDAYLCLRTGNSEKAIELANSLKEGSEKSRAMLVSSIAYYGCGNEIESLRCLFDASAGFNDKLWAKSVAIGFFKRLNISGIDKFLGSLMQS